MEAGVSSRFGLGVLAGALAVAAVAAATGAGEVDVQLFRFRPARLEARPGARVQWTNRDDITHTVTAGTPEARQSAFRLVLDGRGATASAAFGEPGVYPYFCERHQTMRGEIRIE